MTGVKPAVTFFADYAATEKREEVIAIDELAELIRRTSAPVKNKLPWLKLSRFGNARTAKGSLRHDRNLIAVSGIEGDYDGGLVNFDVAVETSEKAGLLAIVYTSPSYCPERPRWRILCPTSKELPPAQRAHLVGRLNGLYHGIFAAESWTLSQSYYFGAVNNNTTHQVAVIDGTPIDELDELDETWIGKPHTQSTGNGADTMQGPVDEEMLLDQICTGASYHVPAIRLLGAWANHGMPLIEARQKLVTAFDAVDAGDRNARWHARVHAIPGLLGYVWGKEAQERDAKEVELEAWEQRQPPSVKLNGSPEYEIVSTHDAGDIDITKIPPRGWLLGVTFCRKFISGLIAEGGAGKTAIRYAQYLAAASGRPITGEHVHVRSRVLIVCLEDDLNEVQRRIGAAMLHHGIKPEDIKGWLYYCTPRGLKLLQTDPRGARTIGALHSQLQYIINELKIDIVGIDPFVKAHGVEENDNNAIDQVCIMLADLADQFDCGIDIVSHARKGQAIPGDVDRDRGASSKKDAGRLMRTVTGMTADEAALFEVRDQDRPALIRVDDAKINLAPRSPDAAWFKLIGVPLGNTFDPCYPHGDNVQTVERWRPKDVFAKLDTMTIDRILNRIEAGPYEGGRYSPAANATDRAAWRVVQEFCPDATEKQAKHVIATWIKSGVLVKRLHKDPKDSHEHPSLFVGNRPGNTWGT